MAKMMHKIYIFIYFFIQILSWSLIVEFLEDWCDNFLIFDFWRRTSLAMCFVICTSWNFNIKNYKKTHRKSRFLFRFYCRKIKNSSEILSMNWSFHVFQMQLKIIKKWMIIFWQKSFFVVLVSSENIFWGMCHFEYQGQGWSEKFIFLTLLPRFRARA